MKTRYKMKSYELTEDFIKTFKDRFINRDITITVKEPCDETAYLLSNGANRKHLLESLEAGKQGKLGPTFTYEEFEKLTEKLSENNVRK